jgi:hypothetical protein
MAVKVVISDAQTGEVFENIVVLECSDGRKRINISLAAHVAVRIERDFVTEGED